MNRYRAVIVSSPKQYQAFYRFPQSLYKNEPNWTPPLWSEERRGYQTSNPMLEGVKFQLLLAFAEQDTDFETPLGRLMVYHDKAFNESQGEDTALFGAYDVADDPAITQALFQMATKWAREQGLKGILGPINPVAEFWGVLIEGFHESSMFLTPYNFPYYDQHLFGTGFVKAMDLYAYQADAKQGYEIPQRYTQFMDRFLRRNPHITLRSFNLKKLKAEADAIYRISNIALAPNWGYVPVDQEISA
jgi:hypothetical protein